MATDFVFLRCTRQIGSNNPAPHAKSLSINSTIKHSPLRGDEMHFLQALLLSLELWILVLGALTSWQWFSVLALECSAASASVKFMLFTYIFVQDENILLEFWSSKIKQGEIFNWLNN